MFLKYLNDNHRNIEIGVQRKDTCVICCKYVNELSAINDRSSHTYGEDAFEKYHADKNIGPYFNLFDEFQSCSDNILETGSVFEDIDISYDTRNRVMSEPDIENYRGVNNIVLECEFLIKEMGIHVNQFTDCWNMWNNQ